MERAMRRQAGIEAMDRRLGVVLIAPSVILFAVLIFYPLLASCWLSFTSTNTVTQQGSFVGGRNYAALLSDPEFWVSLGNNLIWTASTLVLQVTVGIGLALLLHQRLLFRGLARSLLLFPYLLPTVVAVLVWRWLLNDLFGVLNYATLAWGIVNQPIDWLGRMPNAMLTIIAIGTWKYFPFVVIAVLAR